ncbi:HIT family protein [uncultured Deefgea sp.]|uniref:HIT family protein n=1 Tax=uncultured Deefgea sp. TaxID=1304914 RepID=UPI00262650CD|nr:HIT family protein [uncultured Deefgea sp.]
MTVSTLSCPFCKIAADLADANVIYQNTEFFCISPLQQEVIGHTLIVSRQHYTSLLDAPPEIGVALIEACQSLAKQFNEALEATGFNILNANEVAAQQSVAHLHLHFLPRRFNDDINAWPDFNYSADESAKYHTDATAN